MNPTTESKHLTEDQIKEMLEKQLQLLHEHSRKDSPFAEQDIARNSEQMLAISRFLLHR